MTVQSHNQLHPALQFLIFILLLVAIIFIGNIIGAGIAVALYGIHAVMDIAQLKFTEPHVINALWIIQIAGTTLPILAAPIFFAFVIAREPRDYLKPDFRFPWVLMLLVFVIMFVSTPLIEFLSNINQKMVLPHFLSWMRDKEIEAQKLTEAMLQMNTIWDMIKDVLLVGLLTAIVEEFMFRGVLQTIFVRWTKNTHAAIWLTAILFSAFHMQFFGFLPRLLLGALFGYFVAWSGSVWTGVWAHFINNGTAVVATYLFQKKTIKINPDDQHLFGYSGYIFSLVVILFLFFIYRKIALEKRLVPATAEQTN
ncbi:MAG: CPBP family intramembrane metalloprotease [Bacteroidota bacterium]|nr:CPBP family intramembrane metalloprotease [Bacteroidota bacterium]